MTGKRGDPDAESQPVPSRTVRVDAPSRAYDVIVGDSIRFNLVEPVLAALPGARKVIVFRDAGIVDDGVVTALHSSLDGAGLDVIHGPILQPSERVKNLSTVEQLLETMSAAKLDRNDAAVVLGGGVLGDLAGFAAASYRRGIRWINLPSTLLAMVDASVGGKTGANLTVEGSLKKNMVGAFWQPSLVAVDVGLLRTLDDRHFRAGLAECIKHGMLAADFGDAGLGEWTAVKMATLLLRDAAALVELVTRNITIKAAVIGKDEREEAPDGQGGRALLNLGHTYGHVLETLPGLELHHGEAVGLGLIAASAAAVHAKLVPSGFAEHTRRTVAAAGLPTRANGLRADSELLDLMMHDKKVSGGTLRLVLPHGPGKCRVLANPAVETVFAGWSALRTG